MSICLFFYYRAEETTFDAKEKARFDDFCTAYGHSLLPYINKCLQTLFPPPQLAQVLGVTVSDMQKMVGWGLVLLSNGYECILSYFHYAVSRMLESLSVVRKLIQTMLKFENNSCILAA